jgi:hypothetical protein
MCYYTVTLEHTSNTDGHKRAIMILDAKNKEDATARFLLTFGTDYYKDVKVIEGIHVPEGFDRLLTEQVKRYILKVKTKAEDAPPLLSYQNMIQLNYAA